MPSLLRPEPKREQAMYNPVKVYNFSDTDFYEEFAGEGLHLPPKTMTYRPAQEVWSWAGDPALREDPKLWYKELARLKFRRGEGTEYFDFWLKGHKLVWVGADDAGAEVGNYDEGFYDHVENLRRKYITRGIPIPPEMSSLDKLRALPNQSVLPVTDADFQALIARSKSVTSQGVIVKGSTGGIGLDADSEASMASSLGSASFEAVFN